MLQFSSSFSFSTYETKNNRGVKNMTPRTRKMPAFLLCRVFFLTSKYEIDSKTIFGAYLPQRGVIYAVF